MSATDDYIKSLEASIVRKDAERQALVEEFGTALNSKKELTIEDTHAEVAKLLPEALATMHELMTVGESDTLRWSIAKFVIGTKLGNVTAESGDTFKTLINELTAKSTSVKQ